MALTGWQCRVICTAANHDESRPWTLSLKRNIAPTCPACPCGPRMPGCSESGLCLTLRQPSRGYRYVPIERKRLQNETQRQSETGGSAGQAPAHPTHCTAISKCNGCGVTKEPDRFADRGSRRKATVRRLSRLGFTTTYKLCILSRSACWIFSLCQSLECSWSASTDSQTSYCAAGRPSTPLPSLLYRTWRQFALKAATAQVS